MSITDRVHEEVAKAMKARDAERLSALRTLLAALQVEAKSAKGGALDEQAELAVLRRERKRRAEAAEAYRGAGREESALAEEFEMSLIDSYLPAQMADAELAEIVDAAVTDSGAASAKEVGKVMSVVMPKVKGRADGKRVSAAVRERLGA